MRDRNYWSWTEAAVSAAHLQATIACEVFLPCLAYDAVYMLQHADGMGTACLRIHDSLEEASLSNKRCMLGVHRCCSVLGAWMTCRLSWRTSWRLLGSRA